MSGYTLLVRLKIGMLSVVAKGYPLAYWIQYLMENPKGTPLPIGSSI